MADSSDTTPQLVVGAKATVHGLKARQDLNGKVCVLRKLAPHSDGELRWHVEFEHDPLDATTEEDDSDRTEEDDAPSPDTSSIATSRELQFAHLRPCNLVPISPEPGGEREPQPDGTCDAASTALVDTPPVGTSSFEHEQTTAATVVGPALPTVETYTCTLSIRAIERLKSHVLAAVKERIASTWPAVCRAVRDEVYEILPFFFDEALEKCAAHAPILAPPTTPPAPHQRPETCEPGKLASKRAWPPPLQASDAATSEGRYRRDRRDVGRRPDTLSRRTSGLAVKRSVIDNHGFTFYM